MWSEKGVREGRVCGWVGGWVFADALSHLFSLCSLEKNNIGDDGARAVGDALKTNTTLTEL